MKKEDIDFITQKVHVLHNEKLQKVLRAGTMAMFQFGEYVEHEFYQYSKGKIISSEKVLVPKLNLHADCFFRLSDGEQIILSRGDIFEPADKISQEKDFDYSNFNWANSYGNNRFEEIVCKYFGEEIFDFTVKDIFVSKLGDIKISFTNNYSLEVFPDISGDEECWRFFEIGSKDHTIVNGKGLEK